MSEFFDAANGWKIVLHKADEGGYWGEIPAMPGCVSEGDTPAATRKNVIEAAYGCLEAYLSMAIDKLKVNNPLRQGTLQSIFNSTGMPKPSR